MSILKDFNILFHAKPDLNILMSLRHGKQISPILMFTSFYVLLIEKLNDFTFYIDVFYT